MTQPDSSPVSNDFITKITNVVHENIDNEQFGVSELADAIGMSRSNLLRKIKKSTELSVSQFIRQVRLERGMELLQQQSLGVSEVSYQVGFSSPSYFIKCFHDHYGYPPGEVGKRDSGDTTEPQTESPTSKKSRIIIGATLVAVLILAVLFFVLKPMVSRQSDLEKSIAVLPFINDSQDSTNIHIMNGLMESILINLQQIEDLRVISRTSVEKYRNLSKTIPEIGDELHSNYFVEGSGQRIGDQIVLHVQLIEAPTDRHLWAKKYQTDSKDIFKLQREVALDIAHHVEASITPEEAKRMDKAPTQNTKAYELFLIGLDLFHQGNREALVEAIDYFKKAIELDPVFARAYADVAISYYYLDAFQAEKLYATEINTYADQAFLYDPKLAQSLIAKALSYMQQSEFDLAIPYLEKALEYHPNSALVINILSDFYTTYTPNTEKYLEYAIKGIRLDIAAHDSSTASYIYLHVGNAFIQAGFIDEAEMYVNKSLVYNPENLYSAYVKAFIIYARDRDLARTKALLVDVFDRDSSRLDVMQEVGKICYYMRDYEAAYAYYGPFLEIREALKLDIYWYENAKIASVLSHLGRTQASEQLMAAYKAGAEADQSLYRALSLAMYEAHYGHTDKALEYLSAFAQQEDYHYWTILFLKIDPLVDSLQDLPEFKTLLQEINNKFWSKHKEIREGLREKGLL